MRDKNLYRSSDFELRDAGNDAMPVMSVNFARFGEWTEINSIFEGHFMERFAPGAFKKTFAEQGSRIRAIFQHGQDPTIGLKPLGSVLDMSERSDGAYGDVELLDTDYVRELLPGLKARLYGASFSFRSVREDVVKDPMKTRENPLGIPEVTVTEAAIREFGPVTFGQYENASATVRSLTDDYLATRDPEGFRRFAERVLKAAPEVVPEAPDEDKKTSDEEEQAPADRATPAQLVRFGDRYLLVGQRTEDGAPGAQSTPQQGDTNDQDQGETDA